MAENDGKTEYELPTSNLSKPAQPPYIWRTSIDMLTWNLGSTSLPDKSSTWGFAAIRDAVVPVVHRLLKKDCVCFLQELPSVNIVRDLGFQNVTAEVGSRKKEAGVSTPQGGNRLNIQLGDLLGKNELVEEFGVKKYVIGDGRLCGRIITITCEIQRGSEYACEIALLSYHAPYIKLTLEERQKLMIKFFDEICELADTMKKTIIIGGDFNLAVINWKDNVEQSHSDRVSVAQFTSPRRGDNYIDTFAIVQPADERDRTECYFKDTYAIYPFPLYNHFAGEKSSLLTEYPSKEDPWFMCIQYCKKDKENVYIQLEKRVADLKKKQQANTQGKADALEYELSYRDRDGTLQLPGAGSPFRNQQNVTPQATAAMPGAGSPLGNQITPQEAAAMPGAVGQPANTELQQLTEGMKGLNLQIIERKLPPETRYWPNSPLHYVLDHDPVLANVTLGLKLKQPGPLGYDNIASGKADSPIATSIKVKNEL